MRSIANSLLIAAVIALVMTFVWVDPASYELTRQVGAVELSPGQEGLILLYSWAWYLVFALPLAALLAFLLRAQWSALRRGARRLRRVLLALVCSAAMAAALAAYRESAPGMEFGPLESETSRDLNIILIVIDTLRADHLGVYGYHRETSPTLDALASEGVVFEHCFSAASWTKPSVASILTSLHPTVHGAVRFENQLPLEATTLAELLQDEGFLTYAYITNPNLKSIFNFDQGFDFFDDYLLRDSLFNASTRQLPLFSDFIQRVLQRKFTYRDFDSITVANQRIFPWLDRYHDQNFFMYLHYMDPHKPFRAPEPYHSMFVGEHIEDNENKVDRYDGEIRYLDHHLGELFERLKEQGVYEKTLIVVTSDHGEAFGEHGESGHGASVYQTQVHVPLIIKEASTGLSGVVVPTAVESLDLAPTILDLAGSEPSERMAGRSLRPLLEGDVGAPAETIIVDHTSGKGVSRLYGVVADGRWKYIRTVKNEPRKPGGAQRLPGPGAEELYDVANDPGELRNLAGEEGVRLAELREESIAFERQSQEEAIQRSDIEIDGQTQGQLEALGYLK